MSRAVVGRAVPGTVFGGAVLGRAIPFALWVAALAAAPIGAGAQEVFRSTQSANLPTAATLPGGSWMFEISHRFDNPISAGADALWGLDGPVRNRLGFAYAPTDRVMLAVQRSNFRDNLELNAKVAGIALGSDDLPIEVGAQVGVAWNTQLPTLTGFEEPESALYGMVMVNALLADRLAVGVAPAVIRNPWISEVETSTTVAVGVHSQLYLNRTWSVFGEWIVSEERATTMFDSGTFGFEIRTRGHFFKLMLTNQPKMNPTQFLPGTNLDFTDPDVWRLGFNITRLLPF